MAEQPADTGMEATNKYGQPSAPRSMMSPSTSSSSSFTAMPANGRQFFTAPVAQLEASTLSASIGSGPYANMAQGSAGQGQGCSAAMPSSTGSDPAYTNTMQSGGSGAGSNARYEGNGIGGPSGQAQGFAAAMPVAGKDATYVNMSSTGVPANMRQSGRGPSSRPLTQPVPHPFRASPVAASSVSLPHQSSALPQQHPQPQRVNSDQSITASDYRKQATPPSSSSDHAPVSASASGAAPSGLVGSNLVHAPPSGTSAGAATSATPAHSQQHERMSGIVEGRQARSKSHLPVIGGYAVEVLEPPASVVKDYLCQHCRLLLREPLQSLCGHRFCSSCYKHLLSQPGSQCPDQECRETLQPSDFRDVHAARDVNAMRVCCLFKKNGCEWQGKVEELEGHLEVCGFTEQACPNPGCTATATRSEMPRHAQQTCEYRRIPCEYCGSEVPFCNMTDHFQRSCENLPVDCLYQCGSRVSRSEVNAHLQRCNNVPTFCKYRQFGCKLPESPRHEVLRHEQEDASVHLDLMWSGMVAMQSTMQTLTDTVQELRAQCSKEAIHRECVAVCNTISPQGALAAAAPHGERIEDRLGTLEEVLKNVGLNMQTLSKDVQKISGSGHHSGSMASGNTVEVTNRLEAIELAAVKRDDCIGDLGLRLDILDVKETRGVLLWKITDLRRRVQEGRSKVTPSIYSAPFYTSSAGYKMCCRVYLDGDGIGRGTHVSIFFVLMQGEFDNLLVWPFPFKVTLMLMNQNESILQKERPHFEESFRPGPNSAAFQKPRTPMNTGTGCPKFAPREVLDAGSSFVRDDSIFIKVAVSHPKDIYVAPDRTPP